MKEHKERSTNPKSKSILLVALLGASALVMSAPGAFAQYDHVITPNQFIPQTWGGNLLTDTAGAYTGDPGGFYYWTPNFTATPSATMIIPLPAGLPAGAHQYDVYEWIPALHNGTPEGNGQWHVVDIAADGTMGNNPDHSQATGIPWAGQFGTDHQYLQDPQNNGGGWLKLGPGPQSDSTVDGGSGVWINPSATIAGHGQPYLQIHYQGFENTPETFDAIRVVQIDVVPEPSTLALGLLGGFALLTAIRRAKQ